MKTEARVVGNVWGYIQVRAVTSRFLSATSVVISEQDVKNH